MKSNLREAIAQEKQAIQQALMALGYYPYNIKFHGEGGIELSAREYAEPDNAENTQKDFQHYPSSSEATA